MFLVCAALDTDTEPKKLSARLGVKPSAPLRLAADDLFKNVLQLPAGSVNPFVLLNESAKDVTLLLDTKFRGNSCLFHPMQNDYTTSISSTDLEKFLNEGAHAKGRWQYVDFASEEKIDLEEAAAAGSASAAKKQAPPGGKKEAGGKKDEKKEAAPPAAAKKAGPQTKFADDHLFKWKPAEQTLFKAAFEKYEMKLEDA